MKHLADALNQYIYALDSNCQQADNNCIFFEGVHGENGL